MKKMYWVTLSQNGHFSTLKVRGGISDMKNLNDFIVFEHQKDAEQFLEKLQNFIFENYKDARNKNWYV